MAPVIALGKENLLEEDEDRLDYVPVTQLDGKRLEREVIAMDDTYKESEIVHEADDVPLNAIQEHLEEELLTQGSKKRPCACREPS